MKYTTSLVIALFIGSLILFSCGDNSEKVKTEAVEKAIKNEKKTSVFQDNEGNNELNTDATVVHEASLMIKNLPENDMGNPSSDISLKYNGKIMKLANIMGNASLYEKAEFEEKEIPKDALTACGAWWAGAGDYFYVIPTKKGVAVYQGWQDEGQEDAGYHWKKLKEYVD